ncbi:hypothetical protein [Allosphingosinicella sp.]|jgi:hypothetical protein|uniref:hypothetical protein n=1 Tax=Allosphingosinicella sp. TaxID=2823234 RepID=UPI002EDE3CC9
MTWYELKDLVGFYTGLEQDALHVHAALALYILAMGLFRRSRRSRVPWLVVLGLELANEAYDLQHNWPDGPDWALHSSAKDLWNTMLWPTVLLFVGRYTSWFQRPRPGAEPELRAEPGEPRSG